MNQRNANPKLIRNAVFIFMATLVSCAHRSRYDEPKIPVTQPSSLCTETCKKSCRRPSEVEALLESPDLRILEATGTPGGMQGAHVLTLRGQQVTLRAKWRVRGETSTLLSRFSDARRGAIAYHVQQLFLDEDQYLVPPTMGYCFPLGEYRKMVDPHAESNVEDAACVFGFLSYWLSDKKTLDDLAVPGSDFESGRLYSESRFRQHGRYAGNLSAQRVCPCH